MDKASQNFWDFSVELYARERVADACLDLQNSYNIDVNLLLFCYWHGLHHGVFSELTLRRAIDYSVTWKQEVVQPLRTVRQWMKQQNQQFLLGDKSQFETLRARIKFDELAAEKYQQEFLEQITIANADAARNNEGLRSCGENIDRLFVEIGLEMNDLIAAKLKTITRALEDL